MRAHYPYRPNRFRKNKRLRHQRFRSRILHQDKNSAENPVTVAPLSGPFCATELNTGLL